MNKANHQNCTFYGLATVGTKGQIVIPSKAREALGIDTGDSLVIIGIKDRNMLGICPVSQVEAMLTEITQKLQEIKTVINQDQSKKTKG